VDAIDPDTGAPVRARAVELELREAERELQRREEPPAVQPTTRPVDRPPQQSPAEPGAPAARPSRSGRLIAAASVTAIVLLLAGFAFGRLTPAPEVGADSGSQPLSAGSTAGPTVPSGRAPGLYVFGGKQGPDDIPPVPLGFGVAAASTRSLGNFAPAPDNALTFAARTVGGLVCLAVVLADLTSSMTCVTQAQYSSEGIRLRLTTPQTLPSPDYGGPRQPVYFEYYWSRDGALRMTSNGGELPVIGG
jgi:hypothetical protein